MANFSKDLAAFLFQFCLSISFTGFVGYRITSFKCVGSGHLLMRLNIYFTRSTKVTTSVTTSITTTITTAIKTITQFNHTVELTTKTVETYEPCLTKEHFGNCSGKP